MNENSARTNGRPSDSSRYTHAGGIVYRRAQGWLEILIVTGKKNPGDWVFPKGKIEPGETLQETAVREVLEETGVLGRITVTAGSSEYTVDGKSILIKFYLMEKSGGDEKDQREGRRTRWCGYDEALSALSFQTSRDLLKAARQKLK